MPETNSCDEQLLQFQAKNPFMKVLKSLGLKVILPYFNSL